MPDSAHPVAEPDPDQPPLQPSPDHDPEPDRELPERVNCPFQEAKPPAEPDPVIFPLTSTLPEIDPLADPEKDPVTLPVGPIVREKDPLTGWPSHLPDQGPEIDPWNGLAEGGGGVGGETITQAKHGKAKPSPPTMPVNVPSCVTCPSTGKAPPGDAVSSPVVVTLNGPLTLNDPPSLRVPFAEKRTPESSHEQFRHSSVTPVTPTGPLVCPMNGGSEPNWTDPPALH